MRTTDEDKRRGSVRKEDYVWRIIDEESSKFENVWLNSNYNWTSRDYLE